MKIILRHKIGFLLGIFCIFFLILFIFLYSVNASNKNKLRNKVLLRTNYGNIILNLLPDIAPNNVKRFKDVLRKREYNGVSFYRVIDDFIAQVDCKNSDNFESINAEFTNLYTHKKGVVSMSRGEKINDAKCGFFITLSDRQELDGNYSIIGYVDEGIEILDQIKRGELEKDGIVINPDLILEAKLLLDK